MTVIVSFRSRGRLRWLPRSPPPRVVAKNGRGRESAGFAQRLICCSLCMEVLVSPRTLPCGHSFVAFASKTGPPDGAGTKRQSVAASCFVPAALAGTDAAAAANAALKLARSCSITFAMSRATQQEQRSVNQDVQQECRLTRPPDQRSLDLGQQVTRDRQVSFVRARSHVAYAYRGSTSRPQASPADARRSLSSLDETTHPQSVASHSTSAPLCGSLCGDHGAPRASTRGMSFLDVGTGSGILACYASALVAKSWRSTRSQRR